MLDRQGCEDGPAAGTGDKTWDNLNCIANYVSLCKYITACKLHLNKHLESIHDDPDLYLDTCSKSWEPNSARAILFPCSNLCVNPWPALAKLACWDSFDWKKCGSAGFPGFVVSPTYFSGCWAKPSSIPWRFCDRCPLVINVWFVHRKGDWGIKPVDSGKEDWELRHRHTSPPKCKMGVRWPWNGVDAAYSVFVHSRVMLQNQHDNSIQIAYHI